MRAFVWLIWVVHEVHRDSSRESKKLYYVPGVDKERRGSWYEHQRMPREEEDGILLGGHLSDTAYQDMSVRQDHEPRLKPSTAPGSHALLCY